MSSLLQLFTRSGAFFFFAALEVLCFYLIINNNSAQQEIAVESWALYYGRYMGKVDQLQDYLSLEQEMKKLQDENASILARFPNAKFVEATLIDSTLIDSTLIDITTGDSIHQRYTFTAADIINKSPLSGNIYYVINRGRRHGVEKHQGVFNETGIIGIVIGVSERHAKVMALHHRDMRLSGGLRGKNFFGSVRWEGGDTRFVTLFSIPEWAQVEVGDTIETTGFSNIFPTGIPIGEVAEIETPSGENTYELKIRLFNDFYNQKHGYVARNIQKDDLKILEEIAQ